MPTTAKTVTANVLDALVRAERWLDDHGRGAWAVAILAGIIALWPVGLSRLVLVSGARSLVRNGARQHAVTGPNPVSTRSPVGANAPERPERQADEQDRFDAFVGEMRVQRDADDFDAFLEARTAKRTGPDAD